ncbi:hypothetical protein CRG98_049412, partial [Punica granatum]
DFTSPVFASGYCFPDSAFRTSHPWTPRPVTSFGTPRPIYCFQDFASPDCASGYCFPDSASTVVLSGLRVPGLCVMLLLSRLCVHFTAFRTSRHRTLRP